MVKNLEEYSVHELNDRWNKILVANVYDALEELGYPDQCLDIKLKALRSGQRLAGPAVTVRGPRAPLTAEEVEQKVDHRHHRLNAQVYPGCVVVIDSGGEPWSAKLGEFESWGLREHGANGVVVDGPVRDIQGLLNIKNFTVFSSGITPIPSNKRWFYQEFNEVIGLSGTLTSQVRVAPGDWIVGGIDGVLVIPRKIVLDALIKAEEIEATEQAMRAGLEGGMPIEEARDKWGRF